MDTSQLIGLVGGIGGGLIGVLGGAVGLYISVRNTHGPRERAFMIRMAAYLVVHMALCLALMALVPIPARLLAQGLAFLPLALIQTLNAAQMQIRAAEAEKPRPDDHPLAY